MSRWSQELQRNQGHSSPYLKAWPWGDSATDFLPLYSHFPPFWGVNGEENGLFHSLCYFEHSNRWNLNQCDRLHLTSTASNCENVEEGSTGPGVSQPLRVWPWVRPSMACSLVHSPVKCRDKLNQGFPKRSTQVIWEVYGWIIINIRAYW